MVYNRIQLDIAGLSMIISSDEDEAYIKEIAQEMDSDIKSVLDDNPTVSVTNAGLLCALDYLNNYKKTTRNANSLRTQIKDYLAEAANAKTMFDDEHRRSTRLDAELQALRNHLTRLAADGDNSGIINELREQLGNSESQVASLRQQVNDYSIQNKVVNDKLINISDIASSRGREIERLNTQITDILSQLASRDESVSRTEQALKEAESRIESLNAENSLLQDKITELIDSYRETISQLNNGSVPVPENFTSAAPAEDISQILSDIPEEPENYDVSVSGSFLGETTDSSESEAAPEIVSFENPENLYSFDDQNEPVSYSLFDKEFSVAEQGYAASPDTSEESEISATYIIESPVSRDDIVEDIMEDTVKTYESDPFSDIHIDDDDITLGFNGNASSLDLPLDELSSEKLKPELASAPQNVGSEFAPDELFNGTDADVADTVTYIKDDVQSTFRQSVTNKFNSEEFNKIFSDDSDDTPSGKKPGLFEKLGFGKRDRQDQKESKEDTSSSPYVGFSTMEFTPSVPKAVTPADLSSLIGDDNDNGMPDLRWTDEI